jgi:type III pantothenate kinase
MLLVMDVGNSNTVVGLYDGDELAGHWRIMTATYRTADELRILFAMLLDSIHLDPKEITGCCISSVVPQSNLSLQNVCQQLFHVEPLMVGPGIKTGLVLQCDNPKEVGADRIVNSVGAVEEYPGALIIVDFGTATNFDVVSANHEWRGGIICPGLMLSADALFTQCAKLPRVEMAVPESAIGRNTITNIQAGLMFGYSDMVDGLVRRIKAEMEDEPTVVATGGLSKVIAKVGETIDVVDEWLTLKGLRAVYARNRGASR